MDYSSGTKSFRTAYTHTKGRLFIEVLAPGRVALGEAFAFDRLQNRLGAHFEGRLIAL